MGGLVEEDEQLTLGFTDHSEHQIGLSGVHAWLAPGQRGHASGDPENGRYSTTDAGSGGDLHAAGRGRAGPAGDGGGDELADTLDRGDRGGDAAGIDRFPYPGSRKAEDMGQPDPMRDGGGGGVWEVGDCARMSPI